MIIHPQMMNEHHVWTFTELSIATSKYIHSMCFLGEDYNNQLGELLFRDCYPSTI